MDMIDNPYEGRTSIDQGHVNAMAFAMALVLLMAVGTAGGVRSLTGRLPTGPPFWRLPRRSGPLGNSTPLHGLVSRHPLGAPLWAVRAIG